MALSGIHVACSYCGGSAYDDTNWARPLADSWPPKSPAVPLMRAPIWSETLASAATTTNAAPAENPAQAEWLFEIRASVDSYIAIGANPDASGGPRLFVAANDFREVFCSPGDKLAWVAA